MYYVAILKNVHQPDVQGERAVSWLRHEGTDEAIAYDSIDEAQLAIAEIDGGIYVLGHNEYARPNYRVVDAGVYGYVSSGRNQDGGNYDWPEDHCGCGECRDCCDLMLDQDREYITAYAVADES